MNPRPLGYEPYDVRLCRPASSLVTALASADGRRAFMPDPLRLPRLNSSRRECTTVPRISPAWTVSLGICAVQACHTA